MTIAAPELAHLRSRKVKDGKGGRGSRRVGTGCGLAAASITALLLLGHALSAPPATGAVSLTLVAAEGDAVTFWRTLGIQADPVLAQIALQDDWDVPDLESASTTPALEDR